MNCLSLASSCFIVLSVFFDSSGQSGTETYAKGARSMGLANAHVTLDDAWSVFNNIGAMGRLKSSQAYFSYDHRLDLNELTTVAAGAVMVNDFGNFGLGLSSYGGELFNQRSLGLGFSNTLGIASFGVKVTYLQTNIEGFGRSGRPLLEFGGTASLGPALHFGAHIYNFTRAKFSKVSQDYLPTVVKAGLSYRPSEKLMINVETEKEIILSPQFKFGMEYNIANRIWARTGVLTQPNNLFFGLGFKPSRFDIDYALSQNYRLGYTHHFSFNYHFNEE